MPKKHNHKHLRELRSRIRKLNLEPEPRRRIDQAFGEVQHALRVGDIEAVHKAFGKLAKLLVMELIVEESS